VKLLALIVLTGLFLACILLDLAAKALPRQELRRRARTGHNNKAHALYKLAAYGSSFDLTLWLIATASYLGLILLAFSISGWLVLAVVLAGSGSLVYSRRRQPPNRWAWALAAALAPIAGGLLSILHPLLSRLSRRGKRPKAANHSHIYEKEDLIELLERQKRQTDNRLSQAELNLTHSALTFSDKKVADVMVPRAKTKLVAAGEPIGPLLMDELHATGLKRFPVVKEVSRSATPEIIGVLYLKDLLEYSDKGKVRDVMKANVNFINEDQSLRQALAGFLKNQSHLLVVMNNFEEFVGTLAIEDVVAQILGEPVEDEAKDSQPEMVE
jgi:CBS domain containing-hemolysin-like protein